MDFAFFSLTQRSIMEVVGYTLPRKQRAMLWRVTHEKRVSSRGTVSLSQPLHGGFYHSAHLTEEETKVQSELRKHVQDHTAAAERGFEHGSICLQGKALSSMLGEATGF